MKDVWQTEHHLAGYATDPEDVWQTTDLDAALGSFLADIEISIENLLHDHLLDARPLDEEDTEALQAAARAHIEEADQRRTEWKKALEGDGGGVRELGIIVQLSDGATGLIHTLTRIQVTDEEYQKILEEER